MAKNRTTSGEGLFKNRTVIVTGGARGIGRAICQTLAENGARVAVNYQQNEGAARQTLDLLESVGAEALITQANVSKSENVERMVSEVRDRFGKIDLLVNNAGIASTIEPDQLSFPKWKRMFEINVDGPFLTTWAVKDEMIEQNYGRIVNISSLAGVTIRKNMIHYATAKAAVISFTRHCAEAFAPYNVRVNCVAPGLTNTDLAQSANPEMIEKIISVTPMERMAEPGEIASVVKFLLSEDSSFVTGQTIVACGGRA